VQGNTSREDIFRETRQKREKGATLMAKARWNGVTLAESEQCTVIEGNYYFPPDYVRLLFHSKPVLSGPDNLVATILMGRI
jgi:uncharacterized protein (DUF427 family)